MGKKNKKLIAALSVNLIYWLESALLNVSDFTDLFNNSENHILMGPAADRRAQT